MDTEEKLSALEDEFAATKDEVKRILLDIRAFLMEASAPLRSEQNAGKLPEQSDSEEGV